MAKILKLSLGCYAHIDDDVFEWASKHKWYAQKFKRTFYVSRGVPVVGGKRTISRLHREIMKAGPGQAVDHIDGNGLNNLRSNLRLCSLAENNRNVQKRRDNTSGYIGVVWFSRDQKWKAQIGHEGKGHSLGYFSDIQEAARVRDQAAIEYFGDFAKLNFPRK